MSAKRYETETTRSTRNASAPGRRGRRARLALVGAGVCLCVAAVGSARAAAPGARPAAPSPQPTTYEELYKGYFPDFVTRDASRWAPRGRDEPLKLSYQKDFFNMSVVTEDARVDALIAFAKKREEAREYREAMAAYRKVLEEYPDVLYRIAEQGIFIPARRYCQRRILAFPPEELRFYRALYDAPAREAFERARRRYSLLDLREVADSMLATSYGDNALFELGNAALDIGHFEEALDCYAQVRDEFPDTDVDRDALALKIAYCRKALGLPAMRNAEFGIRKDAAPSTRPAQRAGLTPEQRRSFLAAIDRLQAEVLPFPIERTSPPADSLADYRLFPPTDDPLNLKPAVWQDPLPVAHRDVLVNFYPVVTEDSIIYRHKNIVYCRSLLSGAYRWVNDLGGRVVWDNLADAFFPTEEVLVQDGLVFTNLYKGGASLAALDQVTGRLRWANGPVAPVTEEDNRTSYFACPAGGRRTIYASYVVDNIEGETHLDTVYGVRAFDSTTGRILWSRELNRLDVGKFMLSELTTIRNRIRSYASPPVLREGTLYCTSDAGVFAALEASTGQVKWITRYPYLRSIHDRTQPLATDPYRRGLVLSELNQPLWYNQRPLIVGDRMYVVPVDADFIFCLDRATGKILWSRQKGTHVRDYTGLQNGREAYLVGVTPEPGRILAPPPEAKMGSDPNEETSRGQTPFSPPAGNAKQYLVVVYSGPVDSVHLLDAATGEAVWKGSGLFDEFINPKHPIEDFDRQTWGSVNARPFLTSDGKLYIPQLNRWHHGSMRYGIYLPERSLYWVIDLTSRKPLEWRLYYNGEYMTLADKHIRYAQRDYQDVMANFPDRKPEPDWSRVILRYMNEQMPVNQHPPFYPFSRMTFERQGVPFELFVEPRTMKMKYDRPAVERALAALEAPNAAAGEGSPTAVRALFSKAELAILDARMGDAAALLEDCLVKVSNEDVALREQINQQLYSVYLHLLRKAIKREDLAAEDAVTLGMSRTAGTTPQEIQTLLCRAEHLERKKDFAGAALCLRNVIRYYGYVEYPISLLQFGTPDTARAAATPRPATSAPVGGSKDHPGWDPEGLLSTARSVMDTVRGQIPQQYYDQELLRAHALMMQTLPSYFSAASPLRPTMRAEARALASWRLQRLLARDGAFRTAFNQTARDVLGAGALGEQRERLREFPATPAAQAVLDVQFAEAEKKQGLDRQSDLWRLEDQAVLYGLAAPDRYRPAISPLATAPSVALTAAVGPEKGRQLTFQPQDQENTVHLILPQYGDRAGAEDFLFLGGRAQKRLDNKFVLTCYDLKQNKLLWATKDIRLKGKGDEAGFAKVFLRALSREPKASALQNAEFGMRNSEWPGEGTIGSPPSAISGQSGPPTSSPKPQTPATIPHSAFRIPHSPEALAITHGLYDVLAFDLATGDIRWRYLVPFDFEIQSSLMFADLLLLSSPTQTIALYAPTGEVAWESKETGDLYTEPFVVDDRLVTVRYLPSGVTARKITTGRLLAYLELPDLSRNEDHPLIQDGPRARPVDTDSERGLIVVTDGFYYIVIDARTMTIRWKRLIDASDPTQDPAMRLKLGAAEDGAPLLWVLKQDFDQKAMWVLDAATGEVLWHTDPKKPRESEPMYGALFHGGRVYGLQVTDANTWRLLGFEARTGKKVLDWQSPPFAVKPEAVLDRRVSGAYLLVRLADQQEFSTVVYDVAAKRPAHQALVKGMGPYGVAGRVSYTVQGGYLAMLTKTELIVDGAK
jgi:outer membrane protein assembly factor BamB/tetratricopeptide (TPR) repeat protein